MAPRARSAVALLAIAHGAAAITSEMQVVLDQHNIYRCMHGVPLLTWDDAIAANAQAWADNGAYEHSSSSSRLVNGEQCGENLAWGYPSRSAATSVRWPLCTSGASGSSPGRSPDAGPHFDLASTESVCEIIHVGGCPPSSHMRPAG